jgi:SAM-dependent methyltransferase
MHITASLSADAFFRIYGKHGMTVLEVGGRDIGGSEKGTLQVSAEKYGLKYLCLDMEAAPSVSIVCQPGEPFPLADGSVDMVVSTSCFEHDSCFWMTFREMARVVKVSGYVYVSAPANGPYHGYPGDCWRFYGDAPQALAHWSGRIVDGNSVPTEVVESFHIAPFQDIWVDFVGVWRRCPEPVTKAYDKERRLQEGLLSQYLRNFDKLQMILMK